MKSKREGVKKNRKKKNGRGKKHATILMTKPKLSCFNHHQMVVTIWSPWNDDNGIQLPSNNNEKIQSPLDGGDKIWLPLNNNDQMRLSSNCDNQIWSPLDGNDQIWLPSNCGDQI